MDIRARKKVTVGRKYTNMSGLEFEVIELLEGRLCKVRFSLTGTVVETLRQNLSAGKVKDPMNVSVAGMGHLGTMNFERNERILWKNMLHRVQTHEAYRDVSVCDRWLCLANFVQDIRMMDNYQQWYEDSTSWHLDKDIKYKGNKVYSKQACSFMLAQDNQAYGKNIPLRHYLATHTDGTTVTFVNQRKFSNEYGLCYKNLSRAVKQGGKTKGWTVKEVTDVV